LQLAAIVFLFFIDFELPFITNMLLPERVMAINQVLFDVLQEIDKLILEPCLSFNLEVDLCFRFLGNVTLISSHHFDFV
jgi:hypothetical protein